MDTADTVSDLVGAGVEHQTSLLQSYHGYLHLTSRVKVLRTQVSVFGSGQNEESSETPALYLMMMLMNCLREIMRLT